MSIVAYLGVGGNVGDVARTLDDAAARIAGLPDVSCVRRSRLYRCAPRGEVTRQPHFINACFEVHFDDHAPQAEAFLESLLEIEEELGRDRDQEQPGGPRPVDLDLLLWGDATLRSKGPPELEVPHPRLHERRFALVPLAELAGEEHVLPGGHVLSDLLLLTADQADEVAAVPE